jgi:hypothetical protein
MLIYSPAFETARRRFTVRFIVVPLLALTGAACGACELSETWPDIDATPTTTARCPERSTESECRYAVGAWEHGEPDPADRRRPVSIVGVSRNS